MEVTAANAADGEMATCLIRENDHVLHGDAAYCAVHKYEDVKADSHLSKIDCRTNLQKPYRKNAWEERPGTFLLRKLEYQKSRIRSKVEYVFRIIKDIFGFRKTRYRGLAKLKTQMGIVCAIVNCFMLASARKAERTLNSQTALLFEM